MKFFNRQHISKLFAILALLIAGFTAKAENTLTIGNFSISGNEPIQIPVLLTNSDPVAALQFTVVMPENLTLVAIERNAERFAQGQTFSRSLVTGIVMVASLQGNNFIGNSGPIAYLTVEAKDINNPTTETITLTDIKLSSTTGEPIESNKTDTGTITVGYYGTATVTATPQLYINPGKAATVAVSLQNDFDVNGIEAVLTLSPGLSIRSGSVELTSRATGSAVATLFDRGGGVYGLAVAGFGDDGQSFTGNSGEIFTFVVEASEDFSAPEGTITISKFGCSRNGNGETNVMVWANDVIVNVINGYAAYQNAQGEIESLTQALNDALQTIAEKAPHVADIFNGEQIYSDIEALKNAVEEAYNDYTLTPDYATVVSQPADAIRQAIANLIVDAETAEKDWQAAQNNQQAYNEAMATIEGLQTALNEVLNQIAENCPDVASQFGPNEQALINALKEQVESAYQAGTLASNYDAVMASVPTIQEAIESLYGKALAAQEAYDNEQKQLANDKANADAKEVVAALRAYLDKAAKIIDTYVNVAAQFKSDILIIDNEIDDFAASIKAAYEALTLADNYDEIVTAPADELYAKIDALIEAARNAQEAYDENKNNLDTAKQTALETVNSLNSQLQDVMNKIASECPDVKDQFTGADIKDAINALQNAINQAYADGTLYDDYESVVTTPASGISNAISALYQEALAAQQAFDNQATLDKAKADADAAVAALEAQLAAALETIAAECPDVKDSFSGASIAAAISSLQNAISEAYKNGTLADDYATVVTEAAQAISASIEQLIADAREAQANQSSLNGALTNAEKRIAELQQLLDETLETIEETCPDVAGQFTGTAIQNQIDALADAVEAAYDNGTLLDDYNSIMAPTSDIETAIADLLAAAQEAQKATDDKNALEAAYADANAEIASLEAALNAVIAQIAQECPDVKDQFTGDAITTAIGIIRNNVETAYEAGTLTALYDEVVTDPAAKVYEAISTLLDVAIKAQQAFELQQSLDAAYANATAVVNSLYAALDYALAEIEETCPDVADEFSGEEIRSLIEGLQNEVDNSYNASTLVDDYEEVIAPADAILAAIEALKAAAEEAQQAYDDESERQAANQAAYEADMAVIAGLESELQDAIDQILTSEQENYGFNLSEWVTRIEDVIQKEKEQAAEALEAVKEAGIYQNTVDVDFVESMIEEMLMAFETPSTGIDSIIDNIDGQVRIFTVDGKEVPALQEGKINIIVYPNGKVAKIRVI